VDVDKITASMEAGVLKIVAPKDGATAARTIEIKTPKPA
jgi:HSP20 family molecular chaperone IbpA